MARRKYTVRINRDTHTTTNPRPTGRDLLELAKKEPPEEHAIYLRRQRGNAQRIELNERVDLAAGQRFMTLPLEQTDGQERNRHG